MCGPELIPGYVSGPTRRADLLWDVAIAGGPDPYTVGDDPAGAPDVVVHPGQQCCSLDGKPVAESMSAGVGTGGGDPDGSTVMLVGTYESMGRYQ